jgi:3-phosphoshikimate 1-carboxyvinyltransferase
VPPNSIAPARIATHDDHRMAMSFALAGLKTEGITIMDPGCVSKTYPAFWEDLAGLSHRS